MKKNDINIFLIIISLVPINLFAQQFDTLNIHNKRDPLVYIFKSDTSLFDNGNKIISNIQVYNLEGNLLIQSLSDTSDYYMWGGKIKFIDINLDGFLDIDIYIGNINLVPLHTFWIFNKITRKYYYSSKFSELNEYYIDSAKNRIESYKQYTGGKGADYHYYNIIDGKLFEASSEEYWKFNYNYKSVINGEIVTTAQRIESEITDYNGNKIIILDSYKYILDSLRLVTKSWLVDIPNQVIDINHKDIYECGPSGKCLKYIKKEIYSYSVNNDSVFISICKYKVKNKIWIQTNGLRNQ